MSASVNPDIVTDGLVLCLDAANGDCFRGESTTNLMTNPVPINTNGFWTFPVPNSLTIDSSDNSIYWIQTSYQSWGCYITIPTQFNGTLNTSSSYTISFEFKNLSDFDVNAFGHYLSRNDGQQQAAPYVNLLAYSTPIGDGWYKFTRTFTPLNAGFDAYHRVNAGNRGTDVLRLKMRKFQFEEKPYVTPFVNGTRGSTVATGGGLADLSGNNNHGTITRAAAPSVIFYNNQNNGSWVFDGTTDKVTLIPAPNRLADSCTEVWFKTNGSQPSSYSMIFGYEHVGGVYSSYVTGPIAIRSNNKIFSGVMTATQAYRSVTSNTTVVNNKFYHVCLNKDTVNGILSVYINGNFDNSVTFDATTLSYWAGAYRGRNYIDIGGYNLGTGSSYIGNGFLNGSVAIAKMYNKVLTSKQIMDNYKALKGRYGL
jgi:hypothetical protein